MFDYGIVSFVFRRDKIINMNSKTKGQLQNSSSTNDNVQQEKELKAQNHVVRQC